VSLRTRPGVTLVEAMCALLVGAVACGAIATLLRAEERLAQARGRRLQRMETVRIAATVLRRELLVAEPLADIAGAGRDTLALRLFRGFAITCGPAASGAVVVTYSGERLPDPTRDSLLPLLPADASPQPLSTVAAAPGACGQEARPLRLATPLAPVPGTPLLVFQHGTYSLSESAFRVQHGGEGKQPLTVEALDDRRTHLDLHVGAGEPARADVVLAFKGTGVDRRLRLTLPNVAPPRRQAP